MPVVSQPALHPGWDAEPANGAAVLATMQESHRSILAHLQHCETELTSFAHELREKGQLKDPSKVVVNPAGPSGARPLSAAAEAACSASSLTNLAPSLSPAASVALSDAAAFDLGLALSGGGGGGGRRQSRPPAVLCDAADIFPDVPTRPAGGGSHKRGRGRKGSKAGAAAATMAVVDVSLPGFDVLGNGGRGFAVGAFGAGVAFTPPRQEYPDAILPLASKEGSHTPLCGAVPQAPNSILPEKTKVAARMSGGVKGQPDEWILAVVQKYNSGSSKYVVLDVDAGDDPLGLSGGGAKQHTIPARYVIALPTSEPSHYSAYNEFKVGSTVLALYPDTTCFYKAYVHTPPSQLETNAQGRRDYMIEFEDESEITGRSDPIRVPQKYTLRLPP